MPRLCNGSRRLAVTQCIVTDTILEGNGADNAVSLCARVGHDAVSVASREHGGSFQGIGHSLGDTQHWLYVCHRNRFDIGNFGDTPAPPEEMVAPMKVSNPWSAI
jgi:hypothetical protein